MADFPLHYGGRIETLGANTSASLGTAVTSGAANTKGSWAELSASIPNDVIGFWLCFQYPETWRYMVDVGVGSGPSTLISNIYWHIRPNSVSTHMWIPLALPAGEALSLRCQSGGASRVIYATVLAQRSGFCAARPLALSDTYGCTTATTVGVSVDPGGTINTKGSWTEITSSTTNELRAITLMVGNGSDSTTPTISNMAWLCDIGVGSAGNEVAIVGNLPLFAGDVVDVNHQAAVGPFDVAIPAGTRISARLQCNVNDGYRSQRLAILGFR